MAHCIDMKGLQKILGPRFCPNYPLAHLTSLKIGGLAEFWACVNTLEELQQVVSLAAAEGMQMRILGKGTDLVIQDGLIKGIIVHLGGTFRQINRYGQNIIMGGGCPISFLIKEAIKGNLQGAEGLAGIPGTLGGGVTMNAGTDLGSLGDLIQEVDILNKEGTVEKRTTQDMKFSYRDSSIGDREIVLGAKLKLRPGFETKVAIKSALFRRWSVQPYREKTAGCVFRNPEGDSAGRLIDEAGLKGVRYGGIEVSKKHANFFVNLGGGTFDEFMHLMDIIRKKVSHTYGVDLRSEVKIWMN